MTTSSSEFFTGKQYHIGASPGDLAQYILLCGDPARAKKIARLFDEGSIRFEGNHREFVTFTGTFKGIPVTVMSTGIGTDNTEIAVIEAAQCVERPVFIRVGSCGSIKEGVMMGDLVISQFAIARENTSSFYLPPGNPVEGSYPVVQALTRAAEQLRYNHHVGGTCSTSSFYGGQCREVPGFPIRQEAKGDRVFPILLARGVLNFEMETSLLYTLAEISTRGIMAGTVCAVYAERHSKEGFDQEAMDKAETRCITTSLKAVEILTSQNAFCPTDVECGGLIQA